MNKYVQYEFILGSIAIVFLRRSPLKRYNKKISSIKLDITF